MKRDLTEMFRLMAAEGGAFRISDLERAHTFHGLLKESEPSFYHYLKEAMLGKEMEQTPLLDKGVLASVDFELKMDLCYQHRAEEEGQDWLYVGRAFDLRAEGDALQGNVSLSKYRLLPQDRVTDNKKSAWAPQKRNRLWKLVTNETWPAMAAPFIRRGRSLRAELHIKQLRRLARDEELLLEAEVLAAVFLPLDARLLRIYQAIMG